VRSMKRMMVMGTIIMTMMPLMMIVAEMFPR
jgi:hypothetical protein